MTYKEFEEAVYQECLKDAIVQKYPEDFERVFAEMRERTKKHYEEGYSVEDTAWGICLLV